jgi:hypothetical protein
MSTAETNVLLVNFVNWLLVDATHFLRDISPIEAILGADMHVLQLPI